MKALPVLLGLVGGALGPVGAGAAVFRVVGELVSGCHGCTIEGGRWLGAGLVVAAAGGLLVAIGVLASARNVPALAIVELLGALVMVAALVLVALDSAELELQGDGAFARGLGLGFLYSVWGAAGALLLAGAVTSLRLRSR